MDESRPILLSVVGDLHINSLVGLLHPDFVGSKQRLPIQKLIWRFWLAFWERRAAQVEKLNAQHIIVLNGDTIEGRHHGIRAIITPDEEKQFEMAIDILEPVVRKADYLFVIHGTLAHDQRWCGAIGKDLDAVQSPTGAYSWWLWRSKLQGVQFNIAHWRRQATLPWTAGGPENRLRAEVRCDYADEKDGVPDFVIRSHGHKSGRSGSDRPQVVFTPAWKGAGEYVQSSLKPDSVADIGGVWFLIQDGKCTWDFDRVEIGRQKLWKL